MEGIGGIWAELGIPPTAEKAAIRRAYAVRLKATRPDVDPQGFARLRQAYERALAGTATSAAAPAPATLLRPAVVPSAPPPGTPAADGVSDALRRGDVVGAAEWLLAARQSGSLPLQQDIRVTDRLAWALAQDRAVPGGAVMDAAERLGWRSGNLAGPWAKALQARLEGERWLAALRQDAAQPTRILPGARAIAARTLLGQGQVHGLSTMSADRVLRRRYGEFLFHAPVIGHHFDQVRLEAVRQVLTDLRRGRPSRWGSRPPRQKINPPPSSALKIVGIYLFSLLAGAVAGQIERSWQGPATGLAAAILTVLFLVQRFRRRVNVLHRDRPG